jgi:hypothetical protein
MIEVNLNFKKSLKHLMVMVIVSLIKKNKYAYLIIIN